MVKSLNIFRNFNEKKNRIVCISLLMSFCVLCEYTLIYTLIYFASCHYGDSIQQQSKLVILKLIKKHGRGGAETLVNEAKLK